jgi:hypothetical protein
MTPIITVSGKQVQSHVHWDQFSAPITTNVNWAVAGKTLVARPLRETRRFASTLYIKGISQ